MTIFELILYACLTTNSSIIGTYNIGSYSKNCNWTSSGELFINKNKCEETTKLYFGKDIRTYASP